MVSIQVGPLPWKTWKGQGIWLESRENATKFPKSGKVLGFRSMKFVLGQFEDPSFENYLEEHPHNAPPPPPPPHTHTYK